MTARENLGYFSRLYSAPTCPAQELLERVDLAKHGDLPVSQFSKGMKNRLSVARALLNDAELLFLDEPTAGLDPINARRIRELIRCQAEAGKTVFLTTHDMSVADVLCHRVAFINEGRIGLIDQPANLKLQYGQPTVKVEFELQGELVWREFPLLALGENLDFSSVLKDAPILTIHSQEATLEEVFIQVTGRNCHEKAPHNASFRHPTADPERLLLGGRHRCRLLDHPLTPVTDRRMVSISASPFPF